MLKLLKSAPKPHNHEELFVDRYEQLFKWALQLTSADRELAEDLVHNAFIQFTLTAPDLDSIQNLEGYLYGVLRFLHLSQMRRATRSRLQQLSIVDYDSAETGLRVIGPREQIEAQDELRRICQYACARKETSKAGSVLILRFFHGYYPSEIVQVLRLARKVADARLQVARSEAKMYLAGSGHLTFLKRIAIPELSPTSPAATTEGFLADLRQAVFSSRRSECLSRESLRELYRSEEGIDRQTSAHIVSCETCLDQVNALLDLPLLSTRFPTDTIGKDQSKRGPKDGSGGGGAEPPEGGDAVADSLQTSKRRAREVFEHRPKELHIAVNGYIHGSQKINAEVNDQTLDLNQGGDVDFVEIFSEQDVRLLLFPVDAPPPSGSYEQTRRVQFSDGRSLEATFAFTNPWPTLHVIYLDPLLASQIFEEGVETGSLTVTVDGKQTENQSDLSREARSQSKLSARESESLLTRSLANTINRVRAFNWSLFLKPASVTALLALMLVAVLVFVETRKPARPLTAAALLEQAVKQEDMLAARTDVALHRTLQLEERNAAGASLSRHKIEIWQSGEKGITARREYDERGQLIAGDWRRRDGVETIYHHATRPQIQLPNPQSAVRRFEDVWQWTPSAKEFSALAANANQTRVEDRGSSYLLTYESGSQESAVSSQSLLRATLVLNKLNLHASEATLTLKQGDEVREFHFVETSFEQPAASSIAPAVFEPEPELLSSTTPNTLNPKPETVTASRLGLAPSPVIASAALEVEVLRLLHQAGADLGEQISVTRTSEGQLQVEGVVETTERKNELLRALDSVKSNPAVKVQINSAAEALQRLPKSAFGPIAVERAETGGNAIPVDGELRRYFAGKGMSEEQTAAAVRRLSSNVVEHSSQVLQHAWALKRLTERFSPDELRNLSPEARSNWLSMIGEHCRTLQQAHAALRQELQPIFFPGSPSDDSEEGMEVGTESDLLRAAERLLGICTSNHKLLSAAFTVSSDSSSASAIKSPQFLRSLRSAEKLSARIGAVALQSRDR